MLCYVTFTKPLKKLNEGYKGALNYYPKCKLEVKMYVYMNIMTLSTVDSFNLNNPKVCYHDYPFQMKKKTSHGFMKNIYSVTHSMVKELGLKSS